MTADANPQSKLNFLKVVLATMFAISLHKSHFNEGASVQYTYK